MIASDPAGPISGTAIVGSQTPDSNPANDTSTAVINVTTSADLAVSKQAPAALVSGGEATYTITVTNNGPSDATNAQVNDTLPAGLTPISVSVSTGSCTTTGQVIACTAARLPAGSTMVASVRAQVSTSVGVQAMTCPVVVHEPVDTDTDTGVRPAGNVSVIYTSPRPTGRGS